GQAVDGPEDTKRGAWDSTGRRIVASFVNKQPGANVVETAKNVYATVERASKLLPPSIHPYIFADRIQTIRASVSEVKFTLLLTAALVVVVIFVFLRNFAATVIPALAIPLALIGTFAG